MRAVLDIVLIVLDLYVWLLIASAILSWLIAEHGISWMLPRIVGHANALDLLMSARRVSSDEALRIGLVNRLYPPEQLREQTYAYARDLADSSRRARSPSSSGSSMTCRSKPWQRPPSTPTGRWWWRYAAAISAKVWRASWKSGRRGLRGNEGCVPGSGSVCRSPSSPFGLRRGSHRTIGLA